MVSRATHFLMTTLPRVAAERALHESETPRPLVRTCHRIWPATTTQKPRVRESATNKWRAPSTAHVRARGDERCATTNMRGIARRNAVRSAAESLVWSGTIPGELPSARRSVWVASGPAGSVTADGYGGLKSLEEEFARRSYFHPGVITASVHS
jgi:hypothetical protein